MAKLKLTKCKPELIRADLERLGLDHEGKVGTTAKRLQAFYDDNASSMDIAGCDVCGGESDANLDACPFCGEAGEVVDDGATEATGQVVTPNPIPAKPNKPAQAKEEKPPPTKKKASKKAATKAKDQGKAPTKKKATAKAKDQGKAPTKKKATAKKAATKSKATKAKAAPQPEASEVVSAEIITVAALDEQVETIRQCVTAGAVALHRMGVAAKAINDGKLWKMRTAKDGKSCYRSFKQFCVEDIGMTPQHIYRAIGVAEQFTEDEVKGLSGNQIRVVMQLPKDARQDALNAAKNGEGTAELSDRAKALSDKGKDTTPEPTKAVTVAMAMGIQKVALYKRPKRNAKVADTENAEPAMSITDRPWLALELKNKVRMIVRLDTNKKGELVGSVEFRRGELAV